MSERDALRHLFPANDAPSNLRSVLRSRGSGGGSGDGMEPRVAHLEAGVAHLERDVSELRTDMRDVRDRLTRLEEKVSHLPSKGFIVSVVLLALAVIAGMFAFQSQIEALAQRPAAVTTPAPATP
ncbi:hypothetical protein [Mangrovibrevibacter kandeliae]|uniref:hypothetical protein n=1 Tax=Mangrovibrevibacter kandeliae TaxID=2968473 RepID=UPI0021183A61|nr:MULTISPECIES: hypothetical protein [unclassified Aurantimonas]MCQ8782228.1 hypothetical protein [Aurantimonas sp. CSK15Z-1]MCW4115121.1 hypothetical protein [Aurantimonas sp. MSK8Z-1]